METASSIQKRESESGSPKRCLVFGGSGALGRAVCQNLAAHGARVVFTYHTGEAVAKDLLAELKEAKALPLDLTIVPDIERVVDDAAAALGGIDAFIQCAGVAVPMECAGPDLHHRIPYIHEKAWDSVIDINVKSTFFACRRVFEVMRRGEGGNIVFIGSIDGVKPVPAPVPYSASKAALQGMTQALAKELGEFDIRVNMVAPGIMDGGMSRDLPRDLLKEYLKHCGLKRLGRLDEIAAVISWLATENSYVTGQTILVDGAL